MTPEFVEALGLWESGELSRDELARRFPDENVTGLLDAFERMSAASAAPTPDADAAWAAVRTRLPVRLAGRRRGRGKVIRLLAAATIAVLVLGAAAYAVVPGVRRALSESAGAITGDPDPSSHRTRLTGSAGGSDQLTPDISGDDEATTDADGSVAGENDADADGDEHADGDADADADEQDADDGSEAGSNEDERNGDSGSGTNDGSVDDRSGSDGGSVDDDSGSGDERAGDAVDGDGASSGSEVPDN
jgi:hypothetical protein